MPSAPLCYPYFLQRHTFILCRLLSISTYSTHMTPIHLPSPILTLLAPFHSLALSDHLSPPLLNQISLIYHTLSSISSPFLVSLIHSAACRGAALVLGRAEQIRTSHTSNKPIKTEREETGGQRDTPIKSVHAPACRVGDNPNGGTCSEEILQYLMFLCDSCLLKAHAWTINLMTFAALFFLFSGQLGANTHAQ